MDKNTFKQEINDYTARGGKFAFAFLSSITRR